MKLIPIYDVISTNVNYDYLYEIGSYANELYNLEVYHIDDKLLNLTRFAYLYINFDTYIPSISNDKQKNLKLNTFTEKYIYTNYEFCIIPIYLLFNVNKSVIYISTILKNFLVWASPCIMKHSIIHYQKLLKQLTIQDDVNITLSDDIKKQLFINLNNYDDDDNDNGILNSIKSICNNMKYNELGITSNTMYDHGIKLNQSLYIHFLKIFEENKYKINFEIPFNLIFILGLDSTHVLKNFKFYFNNKFYLLNSATINFELIE